MGKPLCQQYGNMQGSSMRGEHVCACSCVMCIVCMYICLCRMCFSLCTYVCYVYIFVHVCIVQSLHMCVYDGERQSVEK